MPARLDMSCEQIRGGKFWESAAVLAAITQTHQKFREFASFLVIGLLRRRLRQPSQ